MKIKKGKVPTDAQLMSNEMGHAFFYGYSPDGGIEHIPSEEFPAEIENMHREEDLWWQGELIDALLAVELPFWLMLPNGTLQVSHENTDLPITTRGDFVEISHGPTFLNSHQNVAFFGTREDLQQVELNSLVPDEMPVFRTLKTVVTFNVKAMKDAFDAWASRFTLAKEDRTQVRRINRAMQYFQSLAFAHIPFLNKLITSYRSVSLDPCAFEVSECDVPVWYAQHGGDLARIGLMPYLDYDEFPSFISDGERFPFFAASSDAVAAQISSGVAPGKLELLDALSLSYRGRYEDAVRSAVTAIEVALEAQLRQLFLARGCSEVEANARLSETRNSFFDRMNEYEKTSKRRLPGPLLSFIPYINGIRLRSELESARTLRHKVVHEGRRIDISSRGPMLRVVETMTWIFDWLTTNDEHGPSDNRNYTFFNILRGQRTYDFEYTPDGVRILPRPSLVGDISIPMQEDLLQEQYDASVGVKNGDIELFSRMSFRRLGLDCEEGPPAQQDNPIMQPRFLVRDEHRKAIVFCSEVDGHLDMALAHTIASAAYAFNRQSDERWTAICILQHQCHLDAELRDISGAVPSQVEQLFTACGITVLTTIDLQSLVNGIDQFGWCQQEVLSLLFLPGRQGTTPPSYRRIGTFNTYFPRNSAMSIELQANETLKLGDILGFRLASGYYEESITSLQVNRVSVNEAHGPGPVGVATSLKRADLKSMLEIYAREIRHERTEQARELVIEPNSDRVTARES